MPDLSLVTEAADKHELLQLLQQHPQAVVILDYTLFDLTSADELLILQERFKQVSWILFSDELSENFIRRILFSSEAFSIVLKDAPVSRNTCGPAIGFTFRTFYLSTDS